MSADRRAETNMDQANKSLIELDIAGVHPSELLYAPVAAPEDVVPVKLIEDVCDLGKSWRQGLEEMAERELTEGVEVEIDLTEAFEEVLTHRDLLN